MNKDDENYYFKQTSQLDEFVQSLIEDNHKGTIGSKVQLEHQIDNLMSSLKSEIQRQQLNFDPNSAILMDHLQSELVLISEKCNSYLISSSNTEEQKASGMYLDKLIIEFFDYLRNDFANCFNLGMKIPSGMKNRANITLAKQWKKVEQKYTLSKIDPELIHAFAVYHSEMKETSRLSFYDLDYWHVLLSTLEKIDLDADIEFRLYSELCYLNFNYYPFIQFCIRKVQRDYDQIDNYREEFIKIILQLRTLNQFIVKQDYGYDLRSETLKEVLRNILEKEISCIKKLISINLKTLTGNGAKFFLGQVYFRISISMEQFLFIFRLMIDKGIVLTKRKADLYEFIHSHVGTTRKDNLSVGNMQNTYAENNRITAIKVKALLQLLIRLIDEKYLSAYPILLFL